MPRSAIVVADGSLEAGFGHIARSSAIAVALGEAGLAVRCFALGAEAPLECDGVAWEPLAALRAAPLDAAAVVVLDSYRLPVADVDAAAAATPLVVLHDQQRVSDRAALVVAAGSSGPSRPKRLAGLEYACLRRAFWSPPERAIAAEVSRVLVTTGGGDGVSGLGATLAAAARDALPETTVTLVRGPYGTGGAPSGVALLDAPDSLHDALRGADIVVTTGGQTLLEAAALGTPAIAVIAVENQRAQVARLAELGAVRPLELPGQGLPALLRELDASADARAALARNAQAAVDGRGAKRVAARIAALT
jgi:spore coat polysaccharide biosynthesis predicted glycosyltransferase SpsG